MLERLRQDGISELHMPKSIHVLDSMPLLATGKIDYQGVLAIIRSKN